MNDKKTNLASIAMLTGSEVASLRTKGIDSVEDLLAMIKSYSDKPTVIAQLLEIPQDRLAELTELARKKVSEEFLEMLDTQFDTNQFHFGAMPPEQDTKD